MQKDKNIYHEWFQKADDDEKSILAILKGKGAPSTVCFLCQQMAEKYLKGLLEFREKKIRKIHDLIELAILLKDTEKDIDQIHSDLIFLNRYYIETRYPGDYSKFSFQEAREAHQAAKRIKTFVIEKIF